MPLPKGTRYRVKTTKSGKKIRLAFRKGTNTVIETKVLGGGHSSHETVAKKKRRKRRRY
jgi:hypothetical protein